MKVALEHLDARGLAVDLPMGDRPGETRAAEVRSAKGLGGVLVSAEGELSVSDLSAESIELDGLHLDFGSVELRASAPEKAPATAGAPAEIEGLRGRVSHTPRGVALELGAEAVFAAELEVTVRAPGVSVGGRVRIGHMDLSVDDGDGSVRGREVEIEDFRLRWGETTLDAPRVVASAMVIGWGEAFVLEASSLRAPSAELSLGGTRISLHDARFEGVRVRDATVDVRLAEAGELSVVAEFARSGDEAEASGDAEGAVASEGEPDRVPRSDDAPLFDLRLLDGVSGVFAVDVAVDLSIPLIGSRRATHRFRIPIDQGSVDFIALENDLSTLESALLDFALRGDGSLVLELGLPLLPTRGLGKPIVAWELDASDRALARKNRIRLAKLPDGRPPGGGSRDRQSAARPPSSEEGGFALRKLAFRSVDAHLKLNPTAGATAGRLGDAAIESLAIKGEAHYDLSAPEREGGVRGELRGVSFGLAPTRLAGGLLSVDRLSIAHVQELEVKLAGVRPTRASATSSGVRVEGLRLDEG